MADLGVDRRLILKRILKKWYVRIWSGFMLLRIGKSGVLLRLEYGT